MAAGPARQGREKLDTILISEVEKGVMSWVIGGLVFEKSGGDFEQLMEDGDEDGHFGFAGGGETVGEDF